MQPRVQFAHLSIPDTWPDSVEEFLRIVDKYQVQLIPEAGYAPGTILGTLNPQYAAEVALTDRTIVIQVALLSLPLFQASAADALVDLHSTPRRQMSCRDVRRLVLRLACALLYWYEDTTSDIEAFLGRCPEEMYAHLRRLEWAESIYVEQYRRRRLTPGGPRINETGESVGTLRRMLACLDVDHYKEGWRFDPSMVCDELIYRLRGIFQDGIEWSSTSASARSACIDFWIALILQRLGIEDGENEQQIMWRFRQRLYRRDR
jgi:hypothetical protein